MRTVQACHGCSSPSLCSNPLHVGGPWLWAAVRGPRRSPLCSTRPKNVCCAPCAAICATGPRLPGQVASAERLSNKIASTILHSIRERLVCVRSPNRFPGARLVVVPWSNLGMWSWLDTGARGRTQAEAAQPTLPYGTCFAIGDTVADLCAGRVRACSH